MSEGQILRAIKALQETRDYADEVEQIRITAKIQRLLRELEESNE